MEKENKFDVNNKVHNSERLKELQALPLDRKIMITQARLIEWYKAWDNQCHVALSGGKDSSVLAFIAGQVCKLLNCKLILWFSDTGLEYPEIKQNFYSKLVHTIVQTPMNDNYQVYHYRE